jgi:dUTP pyrophosphatase
LERIKIKVKQLDGAQNIPLPLYESDGASGMDIRACVKDPIIIKPGEIVFIPTGLAVSIPLGFEGQIRPRSGLALNHGIGMVNSPGTIDSDYRGEIGIIMINWGKAPFMVQRGDRIAQMILCKVYRGNITIVEDLDSTERGNGGFGHSGID